MGTKLDRYRRHDYPAPRTCLAWQVTGAGFGNVGVDGRPVRVPVPKPGPNEVLCRVDAVGLCFSDVKMILAGAEHPRIRGRDLKTNPTRGGHEASLTVAAVGEGEEGDYRVGERYLLQADVYRDGRSMAVGYAIPGAMAEYMLAPKEVLHGDAGSYLIPVAERLGYAEVALAEPWACVEAAYNIRSRRAPRPGGRVLVVNAGNAEGQAVPPGLPGDAEVAVLAAPSPEEVRAAVSRKQGEEARALASAVAEQPGFDDVVLTGAGPGSGPLVEAALSVLRLGGVLCLLEPGELPRDVSVDVGRMHYHGIRIASGASVEEAYAANTREEILPGGAVHMSGAGGPMGQMHVQRALESESPPRLIVVTDLADDRLEYTTARLGPVAREKGVELLCVNPKAHADAAAFERALAEASGGRGYDDVVLCAPVGALVSAALAQAAPGGVVNVFAGVPLGTTVALDLDAVARKRLRVVGSSGSGLDDMKRIVEKLESGRLNTGLSLGAVGGLAQTLEGLEGLKAGRFPGKTVVFPGVPDFPLASPGDLADRAPETAKLLGPGETWTKEAEEAFLERMLVLPGDPSDPTALR